VTTRQSIVYFVGTLLGEAVTAWGAWWSIGQFWAGGEQRLAAFVLFWIVRLALQRNRGSGE
jgi:uncharacterized membrane protein